MQLETQICVVALQLINLSLQRCNLVGLIFHDLIADCRGHQGSQVTHIFRPTNNAKSMQEMKGKNTVTAIFDRLRRSDSNFPRLTNVRLLSRGSDEAFCLTGL